MPPLGAGLFEELCLFNPDGWGNVTSPPAEDFAADFEAAFVKLAKLSPLAVPILQRAMAAYFFRWVPAQTSLYVKLARFIAESLPWDGALINLNYERLLELSIGMSRHLQPVVGSPTVDNCVEFSLPHGACHFFCEGIQMSEGIAFTGRNIAVSGRVVPVQDPEEFRQRITSNMVPPVMSYFEPTKVTTACPDFIMAQRARAGELITAADRIAVVGVKVRPGDEHLWTPLANTQAQILYCAGSSASAEFDEWSRRNRDERSDRVIRAYFREAFADVATWLGLC